MLSARLVQLIEDHSEEIARSVLGEVQRDRLLQYYRKLPEPELLVRFEDVCKRLGHWLAETDEEPLARHYERLGWVRYTEQIPLHEVVHAAYVFKNKLTRYARDQCYEQSAVELYAEGELERLINAFFDRTVYHIVRGYEQSLLSALTRAV